METVKQRLNVLYSIVGVLKTTDANEMTPHLEKAFTIGIKDLTNAWASRKGSTADTKECKKSSAEKKVSVPKSKQPAVKKAEKKDGPRLNIPDGYSQAEGISTIDLNILLTVPDKVNTLRLDHILNAVPNFPQGSSLTKAHGTHPFFTGSASYLTYLTMRDRVKFLPALFNGNCGEYQGNDTLFTLNELPKMVELGIDPQVMGAMIVQQGNTLIDVLSSLPPVSIEEGLPEIMKGDKAQAQVLEVLKKITPQYPWTFFNFMMAGGFTRDTLTMINTIAERHTTKPNPLVGYSPLHTDRLTKLEERGILIP